MTKVAFIGLGAMGSRMAERLLDAGHELVVWNRTREKAEALAGRGATVATFPGHAAARGEVVVTMVADPQALRDVTEGQDGIVSGIAAGTTVIEMSTVGPRAIGQLRSVLPDAVNLLDAPVLGSLSEAGSGELNVFVGGDAAVAERWRRLLSTLGTPMHVGPLGSGAAAKLVANSTLFGVLGVLGEAVALARGLGLSDDVAFEILSKTPVGAQVERRRRVIQTGEAPVRFALSLARKDAELVVGAASAAGLELRVAEAAREWVSEAESAGLGERDYSTVLKHIAGAGTREDD